MIFDLSPHVGIRQSKLFGQVGREDPDGLREKAWDMVRSAIDDGKPCFGWELEIPEFYVIYGYDGDGYYFSGPMWDEGKGPKAWRELGDSEIGVLEVYSCERCEPASDRATLKQALGAALRHADGAEDMILEGYQSGPEAFRVWQRTVEIGDELPWGVAYNAEVWSECRYFASRFMRLASDRLGGELSADLEDAARLYSKVVTSLEVVRDVYPFRGAGKNPVVKDRGRQRAARALGEAYEAEKRAVEVLRSVCEKL
jgi:hypothetical protein